MYKTERMTFEEKKRKKQTAGRQSRVKYRLKQNLNDQSRASVANHFTAPKPTTLVKTSWDTSENEVRKHTLLIKSVFNLL